MRALFKVEEVLDNRGRVKPGKELRWELQPVVSGDAITWTELDVPGIPSKDETNLALAREISDGPKGKVTKDAEGNDELVVDLTTAKEALEK